MKKSLFPLFLSLFFFGTTVHVFSQDNISTSALLNGCSGKCGQKTYSLPETIIILRESEKSYTDSLTHATFIAKSVHEDGNNIRPKVEGTLSLPGRDSMTREFRKDDDFSFAYKGCLYKFIFIDMSFTDEDHKNGKVTVKVEHSK